MKRKNILKFVSLLGIGSFVMLAAASCTQASTPTPTPTPNPEPKPNPGGGDTNNPPSGGMNGVDTNPGGGQGMMNATNQELVNAKKALSDLIGGESKTVELYADYAKIKADLTSAYAVAKTTSDSSTSTLDQVKTATSTLQTAINTAASDKEKFDQQNSQLLMAYKVLKDTLNKKEAIVMSLNQEKYSAILSEINAASSTAEEIVKQTLNPVNGNLPVVAALNAENTKILEAIKEEKINSEKSNADLFANYQLYKLDRTKLMSEGSNNTKQPGNYSFVAYASDIASPNWNFAQRTVWTADSRTWTSPLPNNLQNSAPLTDVSWIYTLSGTGAKYTLTFDYYGPQTGYLYFPYKLVKTSDKVGLQYKLNQADPVAIQFSEAAATASAPAETDGRQESAETATANEKVNPMPSVNTINVAKVTLSNLKFGSNTIEFSVPMDQDNMNKVAPMIGNIYITSSNDEANKKQIYDSIFGNTSSQTASQTSVSVDLLKGYSLTTSWSTYIRQFTGLTGNGVQTSDLVYLIGLIDGSQNRTVASGPMNIKNIPNMNGATRTFTIYANAPVNGNYHISGAYLQGANQARSLKFSTGTSGSNNEVTVTGLKQKNWTTLGHFDTKMTSTTVSGTGTPMKRTLTLNQGLNKIVVSGVNNGDTPFIGNLTFTLESNQTISEQVEPSSATAEKNI
uniref:Adhesin pMGA1.3 n=1 Tax=Mycoplasmoides gallisepticum TaxID=2096 RepID=Q9KH14_MYCGL|nr:adhesin pMGA1.3 [Mycoplasmoides gallisepticum]